MLKEEGIENRIARTTRLAEAARATVDGLGLQLFPDPRFASNTVTAIKYPDGVDDSMFRKIIREKHRTPVPGGQAHLQDRMFRLAYMVICAPEDLDDAFL